MTLIQFFENNLRIKELHYYNDIFISMQRLTYDDQGKIIQWTNEDKNGEIYFTNTYYYVNDLLIKETKISSDETVTITYNKNENIESYLIIKTDKPSDEYKYEYTYDSNKNWTLIIEYKNGVPILYRERAIRYF